MTADKHDAGKPRMTLMSPSWLRGVAEVLTFGAEKYSSENWRLGLTQRRCIDAALRHIVAYLEGEDYDPESGKLHLHHASCSIMFASELYTTRPDLDDRVHANSYDAKVRLAAEALRRIGVHACCLESAACDHRRIHGQ